MGKRVDIYICLQKSVTETQYKVIYRYKDSFKKFLIKTIPITNKYILKHFFEIVFDKLKENCELYIFTNDFYIKNSTPIGIVDCKMLLHQIKSVKELILIENIFKVLDRESDVSATILTDEYKKRIYEKKKNTTNKISSIVKKSASRKKIQKTEAYKSFNPLKNYTQNSETKKPKLKYLSNMSEDERRRLFEEKARTYPTDMAFRRNINKNRKWRG